jgi:putative endonuclease
VPQTVSCNPPKRVSNFAKGIGAEAMARQVLSQQGYTILNQRYRTPAGEIDLVVRRDDALGFVEVKARKTMDDAAWSITPRQQRRIGEAASIWLQEFPSQCAGTITFDAVLIVPGQPAQHIVDAFRPELN